MKINHLGAKGQMAIVKGRPHSSMFFEYTDKLWVQKSKKYQE
jgi:hypothetical protein